MPPRTEHRLAHRAYARKKLREFAADLIRWRAGRKLTRIALARRIGCSNSMLWHVEMNAKRRSTAPSWGLYVAICKECGWAPLAEMGRVLKG